MNRFSQSWQLVRASASVLNQNRSLLWFPLFSSVAVLLVIAVFASPLMGVGFMGENLPSGNSGSVSVYLWLFCGYVLLYFVAVFFNAALVAAVLQGCDGRRPTVGSGLRLALRHWRSLLGYAVIAATVGVLLRMLSDRLNLLGKIVMMLLDVAWSLATFFVVPVLVDQGVGPIRAVQQSAGLFKRTWGQNIVGRTTLGLSLWLIQLALLALCVLLIYLAMSAGVLVLSACIFMLVLMVVVSLVRAALSGIFSVALYRYSTGQSGLTPFDPEALRTVFRSRRG